MPCFGSDGDAAVTAARQILAEDSAAVGAVKDITQLTSTEQRADTEPSRSWRGGR